MTALTQTDPRPPVLRTRTDHALAQIEAEIGGRAALQAALEAAPPSTDLDIVIATIADPTQDARPLGRICAEAGITLGTLLHAYKQGVSALAQVRAIHRVADYTVPVTEDLLRRSVPHREPCPDCYGREAADDAPPCPRCAGSGSIDVLPDLARQKVALELAGLLGRPGSTLNITQTTQTLSATILGAPGALTKLQAATARVLQDDPITKADLDAYPQPVLDIPHEPA